jgi:hypothetical protein
MKDSKKKEVQKEDKKDNQFVNAVAFANIMLRNINEQIGKSKTNKN